jgi:hypothetical protein
MGNMCLTRRFDGKYLARYLKLDFGGGAKTLKYINSMMNMMLNLLNFVDLDELDM